LAVAILQEISPLFFSLSSAQRTYALRGGQRLF
jgi:hypothetical protein